MAGFRNPVRFAGMHEDQAEIGGERGIVGVDGIEREMVVRRQFDYFRAGEFEFVGQSGVLGLRLCEYRFVMKAKFAPGGEARWLVPSCGLRRADQYAPKWADHGMAVKGYGSW